MPPPPHLCVRFPLRCARPLRKPVRYASRSGCFHSDAGGDHGESGRSPRSPSCFPRSYCSRGSSACGVKKFDSGGAAVLVIGSDCASCWCVCCIGSCAASLACSRAGAVSGSSRSWSCVTSWRSSGEEGGGRGTRPSTEPCSLRPAGCSRPSAGPVLGWARGRFAAGTGRCLREVAEAAVTQVWPSPARGRDARPNRADGAGEPSLGLHAHRG